MQRVLSRAEILLSPEYERIRFSLMSTIYAGQMDQYNVTGATSFRSELEQPR